MPSHDPTYPLFPVLSIIGFILALIPLSWHVQAWNSGTCAFMIWTSLSCIIGFANSIVWSGNLNNPAPIWCDISSKIMLGASIGIPAAILCISRRLYYLTSGATVSFTLPEKRRMVVVDVCISAGIPILVMILHYIVQGHRFNILEDIGCYPVVYNTLPAYFIYFMWPILLGVISSVFSVLTLRSFWLRRLQFGQLIASKSSMSISRYLRLTALAIIDVMCTVPLGIYSVYISLKGVGLAPWVSWEETHYNFSHVSLIPALFWRSDIAFRTSVELTRWLPVVCAFVFFALFGFAHEARKVYMNIFVMILKVFGIRPMPSGMPVVKGLVASTRSNRSTLRPLRLASIIKRSPSAESDAKSPTSMTSTLVISAKSKTEEAKRDCLPSYFEPSSPTSSHPTLIGQPIDKNRNATEHLALPYIDESDAFTISSFSYYESSLPSANCSTSSAPTINIPAGTAFVVIPPTPPHPPSPHFLTPQHSLPPPPRKQPRAIGSISSLLSTATSMFSYSNANDSDALRTTPSRALDVPEDVGPSFYTQREGMLQGLEPEQDELAGYEPLSSSHKVLGISGGQIVVTIQRQASVDGMV